MAEPLHALSIVEAAERLRAGRLTAAALVEAHLGRVAAVTLGTFDLYRQGP